MIALVIVSHSRELAAGLKRLAETMSQEDVAIFAAAGVAEEDELLGTDAILILNALQQAVKHDGVLVFADLGSAKLNAEMAIELLGPEEQEKVRFCEAPLVEGVLAAAVAAASSQSIEFVFSEAQSSYRPSLNTSHNNSELAHSADAVYREYEILNVQGLHARPAAQLIAAIAKFDAAVLVRNLTTESKYVNAKSINSLMFIQVRCTHRLGVSADGVDAYKVQEAIAQLIAACFGEEAATVPPLPKTAAAEKLAVATLDSSPPHLPAVLTGVSLSDGFALAVVAWGKNTLTASEKKLISEDAVAAEQRRFQGACATVRNEIEKMVAESAHSLSKKDSKIFDAHLFLLEDPELQAAVKKSISEDLVSADYAWQESVAQMRRSYADLADPLLRARGDDLRDVGTQVSQALSGNSITQSWSEPVILCFDEITPSDVMKLDLEHVVGLCVAKGSKTSHAAILASALAIPVIFDLQSPLLLLAAGRQILVDGAKATVLTNPTEQQISDAQNQHKAWKKRQTAAQKIRFEPAVSRDGSRVRVAANMASVAETATLVDAGAEEVGLFRSEFLYMKRQQAPSEQIQYEAYLQTLNTLANRVLTVRTMDIGGDKPLPYLERAEEDNPNLGCRGIRFSLRNAALFQVQLRAILRAAVHAPLRVMFPLISTLDELLAAKSALQEAAQSLEDERLDYSMNIEVGMMIEVPSAVELAPILAQHVDFFSIGSNDLTQYMMAADRANPLTKTLFNPLQPAVLRAIARVIAAAKTAGIWTGLCGAMAADRLAMPFLFGLGLDEFSMNPTKIPEFKLDFANLAQQDCAILAKKILTLNSLEQVQHCLTAFWDKLQVPLKPPALS